MTNASITLQTSHLFLILFGVLLLLYLYYKLKTWLISLKFSRQKNGAILAEKAAAYLLTKHGFEILQVQPSLTYRMLVNQIDYPVRISADFLVRKEGFSFIAEVKNGLLNNDITNIATRRQLLEYYMAYKADGILLVDMTRKTINLIEFGFEWDD